MRIEIKRDPAVARIVKGELELLRPERARSSPNSTAATPKRKITGKRASSKTVRSNSKSYRALVACASQGWRWRGPETPRQVQLSPTTGIGDVRKGRQNRNTVYKISF